MSIRKYASRINMFPHSLTVYHHTDDDTYVRNIIQEAYWYGAEDITLNGRGMDENHNVTVVIPIDPSCKVPVNIVPGDYVLKGSDGPEIESITELDGYKNLITVSSADASDVGSAIDCVVITGV